MPFSPRDRGTVLAAALGGAVAVGVLAQIYAGLRLLALYGDGAYCLRLILSSRRFACIETPRRATQMLLESATVAAVRLGVTSLDWAEALFGLSLQLAPLLLLSLTIAVLWRADRRFALAPAFAYFAGSSSIASNQILEGPTATAYFWLLLSLVARRSATPGGRLVLAAASVPAVVCHEVMVFLGPVLAGAAWVAARRTASPILRSLAVWFVICAFVGLWFVMFPVHPANRDGFVAQMLAFKWLFAAHIGPNIPAILGLLALCAVLAVRAAPSLTAVWLAAFAAAALALTCASFLTPAARQPAMQFYARDQPAFISLLLVAVGLWSGRCLSPASTNATRATCAILLMLAVSTSAVQVATARYWGEYVTAFRAVLRDNTGVVAWQSVIGQLPERDAPLFAHLSWGWTNPDLSLLLSAGGDVHAIVANPESPEFQPWDPLAVCPASAFWHFRGVCGQSAQAPAAPLSGPSR